MQQRQEQKQKLHPQTITALAVLQLDLCQLQSYIAAALLENPVLESDAPPMLTLRGEPEEPHTAAFRSSEQQTDVPDRRTVAYGEDLTTHLLFQLEALRLPPALRYRAEQLVRSLDENGYLPAFEAAGTAEETQQAIAIVQSLEPAGVCARNLSECLCLQLKAQGETGLAYQLAANHLAQLGKHQFRAVSLALGVSDAQVRAAFAKIRTLSPHPCAAFSNEQSVSYAVPDILLQQTNEGFSLALNHTPVLKCSAFYEKLGRETEDAELRQYINQKRTQAAWLIRCIEQRESTILRCAEEILRRQEAYFKGEAPLAAMTLQDIALAVGIHVSTVSRALNGKYIQTPRGTMLLNDLFSAQLGSVGSVSANMAQEAISALIREEDKRDPLSDMRLSELLSARGIPISRRTVAKYRELLRIPSAAGRKKA